MPNITRGSGFARLMRYLAGPGRSNEHTEPHLVAWDPSIMAWQDDAELDRAAAEQIARALDEPRRMLGFDVPDGPVWHCSLSLRAEEGQPSDEQWTAIAHDFVEGMGLTGAQGRADCRWVAARHGLSTAGDDHIHVVVDLVRLKWRWGQRAQAGRSTSASTWRGTTTVKWRQLKVATWSIPRRLARVELTSGCRSRLWARGPARASWGLRRRRRRSSRRLRRQPTAGRSARRGRRSTPGRAGTRGTRRWPPRR